MKKLIFFLTFLCSSVAMALSDSEQATLLQHIQPFVGDDKPDLVQESKIPGLYVVLYGANVFYISKDGRYVFEKTSLIDLKDKKNLTELMLDGIRRDVLAKLDDKDMVVYGPKNAKHTITVFTDIDCPYCQKLHQEREEYIKNGIKLRYMIYPRSGVDSPSYDTAVAVMCSKDRKKAMTKAKEIAAENGRKIMQSREDGSTPDLASQVQAEKCDAPIIEHMEALHKMGLEVATPQIVLDDGSVIRGYMPADKLAKALNDETSD
jgi:thiol:disulfide interchange protein DsbC